MIAAVQAVLQQGGWVSWALVAVSVMLWTAIVSRWAALLDPHGERGAITAFVREARPLARAGGDLATHYRRGVERLAQYRSVLRVLAAVAPLLGLLGTVGGMVEMFGSLHGVKAGSEASVAGGISTALVTTQLGLIIGAPGLVASRLLERRELRLVAELDRARALLRREVRS